MRHGPCFSSGTSHTRRIKRPDFVSSKKSPFSLSRDRQMAEVALKHTVPARGVTVRERLHSMDDAGVVGAFLGGEERAFQELVERYQTRLLNFVFRTIGDR